MGKTTTGATTKQLDTLRRRIDALDAQVAELKRQVRSDGLTHPQKWWQVLAGRFDGDPVFEEIVKEGQKWRRSQRPSKGAGRARS